MSPEEKMEKAINSLNLALKNYTEGNKRLSVGDLDYAKDYILAAIHMTIVEIEDEEGNF